VILTESEGSDDSDHSPTRTNTENRRQPGGLLSQAALKDLSKEELLLEMERIRNRDGAAPAVNYTEMFAKHVRDVRIKFKGPTPDKFQLGSGTFKDFKERFEAYAVTSGWSGEQQVAAMLRFWDAKPRRTFQGWIDEGRFVTMDATIMWSLMRKHFCDPSEERQAARVELGRRVQLRTESILAYEQVFTELADQAELTENEKIDLWIKNIDPQIANVCKLHMATRDRSFLALAKMARRADGRAMESQLPQIAIKRTVHAVSSRMPEVPMDVEDVTSPRISIQAIKEAVKREVDESLDAFKRTLESRQVRQVQQEPRRDRRELPSNRGRGRGPRDGDRPGRGRTSEERVKLPDGICIRCGSTEHTRCAWKEECAYCHLVGHKDVVCYKRLREEAARTGTK
jgi:hypothetical protein